MVQVTEEDGRGKKAEWRTWWDKVSEEGSKKSEGRLEGRSWKKSRRQWKKTV